MFTNPCSCGSGNPRRALHDAAGIFCTFICDACEDTKRAGFNPDIFNPHSAYASTGEEDFLCASAQVHIRACDYQPEETKPILVYQDGRDFYDADDDTLIASFPDTEWWDETEYAIRARAWFMAGFHSNNYIFTRRRTSMSMNNHYIRAGGTITLPRAALENIIKDHLGLTSNNPFDDDGQLIFSWSYDDEPSLIISWHV